jgi:tRNA A37 threonylcarbamoyladenosine synthetase subunit TsaC/SUA5/YrdC
MANWPEHLNPTLRPIIEEPEGGSGLTEEQLKKLQEQRPLVDALREAIANYREEVGREVPPAFASGLEMVRSGAILTAEQLKSVEMQTKQLDAATKIYLETLSMEAPSAFKAGMHTISEEAANAANALEFLKQHVVTMSEPLETADFNLRQLTATAEKSKLEFTSIGEELFETFEEALPHAFTNFVSGLTEAVLTGGDVLQAFRNIAVTVVADVLRAMGKQLVATAAAAAVLGNFGKAAKLAAGAGLLFAAAAAMERLATREDSRLSNVTTGSSFRRTGADLSAGDLVSRGGTSKEFDPNAGLKDQIEVTITGRPRS